MEHNQRERYWLWLNFMLENNVKRFEALLDAYDNDPHEIFIAAGKGDIAPYTGITDDKLIARMKKYSDDTVLDLKLNELEKRGITAVNSESEHYPVLLKHIYDPPTVLYVKGRIKANIELPIAVIGARRCSDYGRDVALALGEELADNGVCVVSGLAYGIDGIASRGALNSKTSEYPAIAVLGSGVDVIYPKSNEKLYERIAERGAVVSEYLPGTQPHPSRFPPRNRIISGLSKGTVVVEAQLRSGTNITVDCALEQGRDIFAVPGRITDKYSEGTNRLIRDGMAKAVCTAADILEEYGVQCKETEQPAEQTRGELSLEEALIVELLDKGERNMEELCELTAMEAAKINSALTVLEISGIIKQSRGRIYKL